MCRPLSIAHPQNAVTMNAELTIPERIALAKAIGEAELSKARAELPSGKRWKLNFTVQIVGELSRDSAIPDRPSMATAQLSLDYDAIHDKVLKSLGLSREQYNEKWEQIEAREQKALARKQAKVASHPITIKGREGDIRLAAEVIKLDGSTAKAQALRTTGRTGD